MTEQTITYADNYTPNDKYNGYTNYETWNVALWLLNDESLYHQAREIATKWHAPEQGMREFVENQNPILDDASLYSDLLRAALDSVNWREVVEALGAD